MKAAFFDTSVIVHAANKATPDKHDRARILLQSRAVAVSTQTLQTVAETLISQIGLTTQTARDWVALLAKDTVITLTPEDILDGLALSGRYDVSASQGHVLRATERAGCANLYTEHLEHGRMFGAVRACNPFIEDFLERSRL